MNLFRKHLQRTPAFTALLALLMAVAIAFCAIGFAAWSGARAQFKQVDAQYTTIAVPRGDAFWTGLLYEKKQLTPLTLQTERNLSRAVGGRPPGLSNGSCIWVRFPICL